jgi:hypothetical protein
MYIGHHENYPLFLSNYNGTFNEKDFRKILKYHVSWKSFQWEPSSMRTDGQTDMTKLIVAFRYFAKAPKDENFAKATWVLTVHFAKLSCFCICARVSNSVESVCVKVNTFCCRELIMLQNLRWARWIDGSSAFPRYKSSFKTNYCTMSWFWIRYIQLYLFHLYVTVLSLTRTQHKSQRQQRKKEKNPVLQQYSKWINVHLHIKTSVQ